MGGKHKKCKFSEGCNLIASFGFKDGTGTQFVLNIKMKECKFIM